MHPRSLFSLAEHLERPSKDGHAMLVPAPKQRNTEDEKASIKAGKSARQI
jgi:hypothetical protein